MLQYSHVSTVKGDATKPEVAWDPTQGLYTRSLACPLSPCCTYVHFFSADHPSGFLYLSLRRWHSCPLPLCAPAPGPQLHLVLLLWHPGLLCAVHRPSRRRH
jgi:hypothetical protein